MKMGKSVKQRFEKAMGNKLGIFRYTKEIDATTLEIAGKDAKVVGFKSLKQALKKYGLSVDGLTWDCEVAFVRNAKRASVR